MWRVLKGYEGLYEISDKGEIKSLLKNRLLKPWEHKKGYLVIKLTKEKQHKSFYIHRLVAETFIGKQRTKNEVNHIDGNKKNNNVSNLEWCSDDENRNHAYNKGLRKMSDIVEVEMCRLDGALIRKYPSIMEAARKSGVNTGNISRCINGGCKTAGGYIWRKVLGAE